MLLRTLHSIYNRTPHELLHEIILVNDNSTITKLYDPLRVYVENNFHGLVRIHILNERRGLTVGRLEGARQSSGQVLVRSHDVMTSISCHCLSIKGLPRLAGRGQRELAAASARYVTFDTI